MTPALIADGGWKNASPVTVSVPLGAGMSPGSDTPAPGTPNTYGTLEESGDWHADAATEAISGVRTVSVGNDAPESQSGFILGRQRFVELFCVGQTLHGVVAFIDLRLKSGRQDVTYRIGSTLREENWDFVERFVFDYWDATNPLYYDDAAFAPTARQFVADLLAGSERGDDLAIRAQGRTLVFDLEGLTDVAGNLNCY